MPFYYTQFDMIVKMIFAKTTPLFHLLSPLSAPPTCLVSIFQIAPIGSRASRARTLRLVSFGLRYIVLLASPGLIGRYDHLDPPAAPDQQLPDGQMFGADPRWEKVR
jgi:hypothetical protein